MFEPSGEQNDIVLQLQHSNVIVQAVPGSGKSTTCIFIAKKYPDLNMLVLTFSARLKQEMDVRVKSLEIENLEVRSFHSFACCYYDRKTQTDSVMNKIVKDNIKPFKEFSYDIIMLDEMQDCTELYYNYICKIIRDNANSIKLSTLNELEHLSCTLCVFGDTKQSIYNYKGSSGHYIENASSLFNLENVNKNWSVMKLSISYRLSKYNANFINSLSENEKEGSNRANNIVSGNNKTNFKPIYLICKAYDCKLIRDVIKSYKRMKYKDEDFMILAPTIRNPKLPIRMLENQMSDYDKFNIFVPTSDEVKIDSDVIKNKVLISTFHQSKGLERKIVIVYNFDSSYIKYFTDEKDNSEMLPNSLYVACSRAIDVLILIHDKSSDYLPFVDVDNLDKMCDVRGEVKLKKTKEKIKKSVKDKPVHVTDLIKHLSFEKENSIMSKIESVKINESSNSINIKSKIEISDKISETVDDINGLAIPAYYEYTKTKKCTILESVKTGVSIEKLLKGSILWNSKCSGYVSRVNQIKKYDWISKEILQESALRIDNILSKYGGKMKTIEFESYKLKNSVYTVKPNESTKSYTLDGYIDCIYNYNCLGVRASVWEFKVVKTLTDVHKIQLYLYAFLVESNRDKNKEFIERCKTLDSFTKFTYAEGDELLMEDDIIITYEKDMDTTKCKKNLSLIERITNREFEIIQKPFRYFLFNIYNEMVYEIIYDEKFALEILSILHSSS